MTCLVCLAYHRISGDRSDPYTVSPRQFENQMAWLARLGYHGLGVSEALRTGGRVIALSFDDGYQDFGDAAWPLLRGLGFGATLFVVSGRVGLSADWPGGHDAPLMNQDQIGALAAAGVEIGAHGVTHRRLTDLSIGEAAGELRQAYADTARLTGVSPSALAYPYGVTNTAVSRAAQDAGFETGWTARGGRNTPSMPRMALRRTLVSGRDTLLHFAIRVSTGYARFVEWKMDARRIP